MSMVTLGNTLIKEDSWLQKHLLMWANSVLYTGSPWKAEPRYINLLLSARMEAFWGYPKTKPKNYKHFIHWSI